MHFNFLLNFPTLLIYPALGLIPPKVSTFLFLYFSSLTRASVVGLFLRVWFGAEPESLSKRVYSYSVLTSEPLNLTHPLCPNANIPPHSRRSGTLESIHIPVGRSQVEDGGIVSPRSIEGDWIALLQRNPRYIRARSQSVGLSAAPEVTSSSSYEY